MSDAVIKDPIFDVRGKIPQNILAQLAVRGAEKQVDDAITRMGWARDLVVVPIISVEPASGKIIGSRLAVRGTIAQYEIAASSIWQDANKDVTMTLDLHGIDFTFSSRGGNLPGD